MTGCGKLDGTKEGGRVMQTLYLSRRNLLTLLSKLDRNVKANSKVSFCTIIKQDTKHSVYPCTDVIQVTAVEDHDYYTDREAGAMHPDDEVSA